jgi:hypothetical protein
MGNDRPIGYSDSRDMGGCRPLERSREDSENSIDEIARIKYLGPGPGPGCPERQRSHENGWRPGVETRKKKKSTSPRSWRDLAKAQGRQQQKRPEIEKEVCAGPLTLHKGSALKWRTVYAFLMYTKEANTSLRRTECHHLTDVRQPGQAGDSSP